MERREFFVLTKDSRFVYPGYPGRFIEFIQKISKLIEALLKPLAHSYGAKARQPMRVPTKPTGAHGMHSSSLPTRSEFKQPQVSKRHRVEGGQLNLNMAEKHPSRIKLRVRGARTALLTSSAVGAQVWAPKYIKKYDKSDKFNKSYHQL